MLVTVAGNYKPGRVTATVTDLVVPATGLAINIQRTYDSLNAGTSGDFGYGWNLGINVESHRRPRGRRDFHPGRPAQDFLLHAAVPPCTAVGCLFPYYFPAYTPEPGFHGTLTESGPGLRRSRSSWFQTARSWAMRAAVASTPRRIHLHRSERNRIHHQRRRQPAIHSWIEVAMASPSPPTASPAPPASNVPFVRDSSNRITQITDPQGNIYQYGYDANGNLASVTYPNIDAQAQHLHLRLEPPLYRRHRFPRQPAAHHQPTMPAATPIPTALR